MTVKELRKEYKAIRDGITPDERKEKSSQIVKNIKDNWRAFNGYERDFLCYYPLGSEPDLLMLCRWILDNGWNLYFPVTEKDGIHFYRVDDLSGFSKGTFGVYEPSVRTDEYKGDAGVSFTPGLIFDKAMNRVGYGGGYYDRFYSQHSHICRVGICFKESITASISHNEWDIPMNMVITDQMPF